MKKIIFMLILFIPIFVNAEVVTFSKCVDGDTFRATVNNKEEKIRLLAVDTPESTTKKEYYGKEASDYTCDLLKNAKSIELEYDNNSDLRDKYGRLLAWVFLDKDLLQQKLVENGYAEVAYLYGDYKYTDILKDKEIIAKNKKIGIWKDNNEEVSIYVIILLFLLSVLYTYIKKKLKKNFKGSKINLDLFKE